MSCIGGCVKAALELSVSEGEVYWVHQFEGRNVLHAYYVPLGALGSDRALNQADNGYGTYPPLTVEEVRTGLRVRSEIDILFYVVDRIFGVD